MLIDEEVRRGRLGRRERGRRRGRGTTNMLMWFEGLIGLLCDVDMGYDVTISSWIDVGEMV